MFAFFGRSCPWHFFPGKKSCADPTIKHVVLRKSDGAIISSVLQSALFVTVASALTLQVVLCNVKAKRRVVKRAFYSSEEDESTEEEIEERDMSFSTPEVSIVPR